MIERRSRKGPTYQGMNWIRKERRLAIYLRDGLACVWCDESVEDGAQLTLDHVVVYAKGGGNDSTNLVTACARCNSSRGRRSTRAFSVAVAGYLNQGVKAETIYAHVNRTRQRVVDVQAAKDLMAARGGFVAALRPTA